MQLLFPSPDVWASSGSPRPHESDRGILPDKAQTVLARVAS